MGTSIIKTTDTSENTIDNIDVGRCQSVEYNIKVASNNSISESNVRVSNDGVVISDVQSGFSSNNGPPLEYNTDISSNVGRLKVTPTSNHTTFYIEKTEYESELFGLHTQSGRKIVTEEGFAIDRESATQTATVRQIDNNDYGFVYDYMNDDVLGPVTQGDDLLTEWTSYNNADVSFGQYTEIISSGQNENFIYQKLDVTPGKAYALQFGAFYEDPDSVIVKESTVPQKGNAFVRISSTLDGSEILNFQLTNQYQSTFFAFTPDTSEIYVKVGYGTRNIKTFLENATVKEAVPFPTYNQDAGTYYIKWTGLNNVVLMESNNVLRLESDIIYYNDVMIGSQITTNQLCIAYDPDSVLVSLNGTLTQEYLINNLNRNYTLELNPSVLRFSYMNEILSETDLEKLSSG